MDGDRGGGHKISPRNLGDWFFLFFSLECEGEILEGPLHLRFQREDQGPFGNQQELINQTGEDLGLQRGEKRDH